MSIIPRKIFGICLGFWFLVVSGSLFAGFNYWIFFGSEQEARFPVYDEFVRLYLAGEGEKANEYLQQTLASIRKGKDNMDITWLPMVRLLRDGYDKLEYYRLILISEPDHEYLYSELAGLLEKAPQSFQQEVRPRYLADINAIPDIRYDYMEKHGLTIMPTGSKGTRND